MDSSDRTPDAGVEVGSLVKPDVMNDPAYDPNVKDKQSQPEEPDTCRICRGEGSQEEPLFYPCKCSGSIKFVHQNCLIEWLSHSQKKYCELCKTPFHFTKLYSPNMPNTVPLPVFLRQAAVHMWKSIVTTSRFLLVTFVWAAWLPWCMRTIWRGLFWIGDGAWVNWTEKRFTNDSIISAFASHHAMTGATSFEQGPLTPNEATASAVVAHISSKLPRFIPPPGKLFSFSSGQPWSLVLLKKGYSYLSGVGFDPAPSSGSAAVNATRQPGPISRTSWLSEFQFMRNLTPSTVINNMLIDTLEGQLITLFVVTAFILIFLIREWVVQQQPILNGGNNLHAEAAVAQQVPAPDQAMNEGPAPREGGAAGELRGEGLPAQGPRARIIARARPRRPRHLRRQSEQGAGSNGAQSINAQRNLGESGSPRSATSPRVPRPEMLDRQKSAMVAEIGRVMEEHTRTSNSKGSSLDTFKDLWKRADRNPANVIKLIEEEGRSDELRWVIAAMNQIIGILKDSKNDQPDEASLSMNNLGPDASKDEHAVEEDPGERARSSRTLDEDLPPEADAHGKQNSEASSSFALPSPTTNESLDASLVEIPSKEPPESVNLNEQNMTGHVAGQDAQMDGIEEPNVIASDIESPDKYHTSNGSTKPTTDNPFSPDFEGDYPQSSEYANMGRVNRDPTVEPDMGQSESESTETTPEQAQINPAPEAPERVKTLAERVVDWLWGGVAPVPAPPEQPVGDDEQIVNNVADEAPFVPIDQGQPLPLAANDGAVANQDPDVVAAAVQAGVNPNEADAAEEIEDLEGILELIGMQGPLAGLVQNGMFCACLVSLTILFGVWVPYISGKLFLVLLAHPVSLLCRIPLRWATSTADTAIDLFTFVTALLFYWTDTVMTVILVPVGQLIPSFRMFDNTTIVADMAKGYADGALERLTKDVMATGIVLTENDIPTFSAIAHESLRSMETTLAWIFQCSYSGVLAVSHFASHEYGISEGLTTVNSNLQAYAKALGVFVTQNALSLKSLWPSLLQINPLRINLAVPQRTAPLDYDLACWNMKDRVLAIAFGYVFFALAGMAYIRISSRLQSVNRNGRVPGGLADGLYQAGGVMKVILIISIEMIVFPLYCGLLLDVALLPLFNDVTILSRINFTLASPNTSLFVHWFVGTCYMFHFALFVSMCRKILRPGVLYFIRDPDDPTFHPVRDVLERSVSTQLWKISFSALVYGGLVIVCLGGVVWGVASVFDGIFPIHWASSEPILEFPVDLLFYNFLMPLAVKFFRPSKGLVKMFSWWFQKCAQFLCLTNFLFAEKAGEEDSQTPPRIANASDEPEENAQGVDVEETQQAPASEKTTETHPKLAGRYVRAPGSDQVRIPRGARTFLEVDEENNRLDGQPDLDEGLHGRKNAMFTKVYIPPMFRSRISAFIFLIWVFAAGTGISMTIVPLIFGRFLFAMVAPGNMRMNDIYAFSVGIYSLGGIFYGILHRERIITYVRDTLTPHTPTITSFLCKSFSLVLKTLSLLYVYTAFSILLPALLSLLMEFYFIIPTHTYFSTTFASLQVIHSERHIIHLVQDWTLGVLYLKMAARLILWSTPSRPANALRAVVRDGWLSPDVTLATRGFIIPATLAVGVALAAPLALGWLANATVLRSLSSKDELFRACVYRYSYPGVLALGAAIVTAYVLAKAFEGWRKKVRDEVYLIGERLHNFGEGKRRKGLKKRDVKGKGRAVPVGGGPA